MSDLGAGQQGAYRGTHGFGLASLGYGMDLSLPAYDALKYVTTQGFLGCLLIFARPLGQHCAPRGLGKVDDLLRWSPVEGRKMARAECCSANFRGRGPAPKSSQLRREFN